MDRLLTQGLTEEQVLQFKEMAAQMLKNLDEYREKNYSIESAEKGGITQMVKVLARSIREFKKPAILTPLLVSVEVVMECAIRS